ncbi:hypothetical protein D3C85_1918960 [compost metagenome]
MPLLDCVLAPHPAIAHEVRDLSLLEVVCVGFQLLLERDVAHSTVMGFGKQ